MTTLQQKIEKLNNEISKARANKNNKSRLIGKILKLIELESKLENATMVQKDSKTVNIIKTWSEDSYYTDENGYTRVKTTEKTAHYTCECSHNIPEVFKDDFTESLVEKVYKSLQSEYKRVVLGDNEPSQLWTYTDSKNMSVGHKKSTGQLEFTVFLGEKIYQFGFTGHYLINHEIISAVSDFVDTFIKKNEVKAVSVKTPSVKSPKKERKAKIPKEAIAASNLVSKIKKESFKAAKSDLSNPAYNQASEWVRVYSDNGVLMIAAITKFDVNDHGKNSVLTVYKTPLNTKRDFDLAVPKKALLDQMYALFKSGIDNGYCEQMENYRGQDTFTICYGSGEVSFNCQSSDELMTLFHGEIFDGDLVANYVTAAAKAQLMLLMPNLKYTTFPQ